jgi:hypothetical protein
VAPDKTREMIGAFMAAGEPPIVRIGSLHQARSESHENRHGRIEIGDPESSR